MLTTLGYPPPCACPKCQPMDWEGCPRCRWPHRTASERSHSESDGDCERYRMEDKALYDHSGSSSRA